MTTKPMTSIPWEAVSALGSRALPETLARDLPFHDLLAAWRAGDEGRWDDHERLLTQAEAATESEAPWRYALAIERANGLYARGQVDAAWDVLVHAERERAAATPSDVVRSRLLAARIAFDRGDYARWEAELSGVLSVITTTPAQVQAQIAAALNAGSVEVAFGDPRQADAFFARALPETSGPPTYEMATAAQGRALALARSDDHDASRAWLARARGICSALPMRYLRDPALIGQEVLTLQRLGRTTNAREAFERAYDAHLETDDPTGSVTYWLDLSLAAQARERQQFERARAYHQRACQVSARGPLQHAAALVLEAVTELVAGNAPAALALMNGCPVFPRFDALTTRRNLVLGVASHQTRGHEAASALQRAAESGPRVLDLLFEAPELAPMVEAAFAENGLAAQAKKVAATFGLATIPDRPQVYVSVFGTFSAVGPTGPITEWPRRKARQLLALLTVRGHGVSLDELNTRLFPGMETDRANHMVATLASTLRSQVARPGEADLYLLSRTGDEYAVRGVGSDWGQLERAVARLEREPGAELALVEFAEATANLKNLEFDIREAIAPELYALENRIKAVGLPIPAAIQR